MVELCSMGMIPDHIRIQISHQHTGRTRKCLAVHLRLARPFGLLHSPGDGGPEARLRSASRISVEDALRSVATSCRNWRSNLAMPTTPPWRPFFLGAIAPSRLPAYLLSYRPSMLVEIKLLLLILGNAHRFIRTDEFQCSVRHFSASPRQRRGFRLWLFILHEVSPRTAD
jgi:hypothetical protein